MLTTIIWLLFVWSPENIWNFVSKKSWKTDHWSSHMETHYTEAGLFKMCRFLFLYYLKLMILMWYYPVTNNNTSYQPLLVLHLYLKHDRFLAVKQKNVASVGTKLLRQAEQSSSYLGVKLSLVPAENDVLTDKTYFPSTYCAGSVRVLLYCLSTVVLFVKSPHLSLLFIVCC